MEPTFTIIRDADGVTIGAFTTTDAADAFRATRTDETHAITMYAFDVVEAFGPHPVRGVETDADIAAVRGVDWGAVDTDAVAYHYGAINSWGMPNAYGSGTDEDPRSLLTVLLSMADARHEVARRLAASDPATGGEITADALGAADAILGQNL